MPKGNRRRRRWVLVLLALALMWWWLHRAPLVFGTFNIITFPTEKTDVGAVAEAVADLDADAFAVQEIVKPKVFERVLGRASTLTGRTYRAALVPYCGVRYRGETVHLGVVYDADRLTLAATRPLGVGEVCPKGQPPGVVALLRGAGRTVALASVHFVAGGSEERFARRREQWNWLTAALPAISAELGAPVIVAGDVNSTGFLVEGSAERRFIEETLAEHELQLPTRALDCSMYWEPRTGYFDVSLLDHIIGPQDMSFGTPEVLGMCAALACEPQATAPAQFETVSDHCPVRVELLD